MRSHASNLPLFGFRVKYHVKRSLDGPQRCRGAPEVSKTVLFWPRVGLVLGCMLTWSRPPPSLRMPVAIAFQPSAPGLGSQQGSSATLVPRNGTLVPGSPFLYIRNWCAGQMLEKRGLARGLSHGRTHVRSHASNLPFFGICVKDHFESASGGPKRGSFANAVFVWAR